MNWADNVKDFSRTVQLLINDKESFDTFTVVGLLHCNEMAAVIRNASAGYQRDIAASIVKSVAAAARHQRVPWQRDGLDITLRECERGLKAFANAENLPHDAVTHDWQRGAL